jgi:cytochrome oxidase Cu insertion factor (SCO1/SenC/PrrC family)
VNSTLILPVIIALVAVIVVVAVARSRRANDGVDSFRRQIDALSPEARRPVVDQVQNAAGRPPVADDEDDDEDDRRGP